MNNKINNVTIIDAPRTKKEQVKEIYLKYHDLPRNEIANKVVEKLLITIESARTHVSWVAKELNPQLNKPFRTRKREKSGLKRTRAFEIFEKNTNIPRKEMMNLFQEQLGMTESSAATHCSICVKKFREKHGDVEHASITRK